MLLALLTLAPATLGAQESEHIYHRGWGFGFELGAGGLLPTASLGDALKGCALFAGGLNAEYNRLRLKADIAYGQPSFKNNNPFARRDEQGRDLQLNGTANPTLLAAGVQLGYTVWRQGRVSVTPNAGVSFGRLSWELNDIKYRQDEEGIERPMIDDVHHVHENSVGWLASVDIDIKLHGKIIDSPLGDGQAHYTSSLRVSPFVTYANYGDMAVAARGCCLGATVTYAGFLHALSRN